MNRLKELRKLRGLTQEALAEKVDMTHSAIQRLEAGKRSLTEDTIMKLAGALNVHPGELFRPMFVSDDQDHAAHIVATMTPEDRDLWLATGRKLAGIRPPEKRKAGSR